MATNTFDVRPLTAHCGAVLEGFDIAGPVDDSTVVAVHDVLSDRGVLIFPGQDVSISAYLNFGAALGPISMPDTQRPTVEGFPGINTISVENEYAAGTHRWHADSSWEPEPQRFCLLRAVKLPPVGGDTLWTNLCAAYEGLSEWVRQLIDPLTAHHELWGRGVDQPLVTVHPVTGRRSLYVNEFFTTRINGVSSQESRAILGMLIDHVQSPEFCCRWRWSNYDVALWDNHFVNHYAVGDYGNEPREINRIDIGREPVHPLVAVRL